MWESRKEARPIGGRKNAYSARSRGQSISARGQSMSARLNDEDDFLALQPELAVPLLHCLAAQLLDLSCLAVAGFVIRKSSVRGSLDTA